MIDHQKIDRARLRLHRIVARHYGKRYVDEVLRMLQAGSTDYHIEVMNEYTHFISEAREAIS